MKKSLIAMFYVLIMLGSGSVVAADANQPVKEHAKAKYVDSKTLKEEGCG